MAALRQPDSWVLWQLRVDSAPERLLSGTGQYSQTWAVSDPCCWALIARDLHFRLFSDFKGVIDLDAKIPDCALQLCVTKQ